MDVNINWINGKTSQFDIQKKTDIEIDKNKKKNSRKKKRNRKQKKLPMFLLRILYVVFLFTVPASAWDHHDASSYVSEEAQQSNDLYTVGDFVSGGGLSEAVEGYEAVKAAQRLVRV